MNDFDRYRWQTAVLADYRLRQASKVVASALALIGDSDGVASVGIPQLATLTAMSERWVSAALDELIEDVKAVKRRRRGFRGKHTAEYRLLPNYMKRSAATSTDSLHSGAASPPDSLHSGAASPPDSLNGSAATSTDSLHSGAASPPDSLNGSAAFLRRRRELLEEEEEGQQREVDEGDVVAALQGLPAELFPDGQAEAAVMANVVRQRLGRGWTVEALVDAARFRRSDKPIGNRTRVLEHRVPVDPPPPTVLDLRRPSERPGRPQEAPWCGECDKASRRPLDEHGYVDNTLLPGSCAACTALAFEAHVSAR